MIQARDRARFLLEATEAFRVGGDVRRQDLDRDVAPEPRVVRAIHLAHAAGAEG